MQNNQNGSSENKTLSWSTPAQKPAAAATPTTKKADAVANPNSRMWLMLTAGLVVGILIAWSWIALRAPKDDMNSSGMSATSALEVTRTPGAAATPSMPSSGTEPTTSSSASASAEPTGEKSGASFTVAATQPVGDMVAVSNVSISVPVWAVVYENNDGKPGRVLGASRFAPGRANDTIHLMRSTLPNLGYFVGLVADTPDHSFGIRTNAPLLNSDGGRIMEAFTAE